MADALLTVSNLETYYGPIMAIRGVSFEVPERAVITILGDLEGWTYDRERRAWRVWSVPGFAERIHTNTSTIRAWARWNEVIEHVRETLPELTRRLPPGFLRV